MLLLASIYFTHHQEWKPKKYTNKSSRTNSIIPLDVHVILYTPPPKNMLQHPLKDDQVPPEDKQYHPLKM